MWLASGTFIKACTADWHHCGEGRLTAVELQVLIQEHTIFMFPQCVHIWVCVRGKNSVSVFLCGHSDGKKALKLCDSLAVH